MGGVFEQVGDGDLRENGYKVQGIIQFSVTQPSGKQELLPRRVEYLTVTTVVYQYSNRLNYRL